MQPKRADRRSPGIALLAATVALGLGPTAGWTQEATPPAPEEDQIPRFETGVNTVLVDALVLDGNGAPVADLDLSNFTILEDGVEQEITSFDVTDWTSYVSARTSGAAGSEDGTVNAYPRRFVLIVNRQGAGFTYLTRAKRALRDFVIEALADGDEAMLVEIGYSVKVLQEFEASKEETLESLKKLSAMVVEYPHGYDRASRNAYRALEELGLALGTLPGRKVVVFFSMELQTATLPGSSLSNETDALQSAIEAFNQSNTSVYTVDLLGVDRRRTNFAGGLSPLALETGGRFFHNQTSFVRPLERIGQENQRYYLLGYSPSRSEMDGTYRAIEVKVNRPGVDVVARRGYFARAPDPTISTEALEADTDDSGPRRTANRSPRTPPPDVTDTSPVIPSAVEMTTYLLPTGSGIVRVPVTIALPLDLLSQGADDKTLSVMVTDEAGETVDSFEKVVDPKHFYVLRNFDLEAGRYLMQITLEAGGEALYQASTGFEVPRDYGARFGISSILPVIAPENSESVGQELPLLPTPTVRRGQNAHILFQIFAGRSEPSRRVRLTYKIYKEDREVRTVEHPDGIDLSGGGNGTPVILSLPTGELTGGVYRVELSIRDEALSRRATSEMELRIE